MQLCGTQLEIEDADQADETEQIHLNCAGCGNQQGAVVQINRCAARLDLIPGWFVEFAIAIRIHANRLRREAGDEVNHRNIADGEVDIHF